MKCSYDITPGSVMWLPHGVISVQCSTKYNTTTCMSSSSADIAWNYTLRIWKDLEVSHMLYRKERLWGDWVIQGLGV